ncbi:tyrosine-protein phosphatase [Skermania sp. ID1734]|uniref:tyrosine-protein phosphatase n=1 Tax=Skermania sp. ID1734 TaxID=2597516 RepID=UPI00117E1FDD|nr:tyrosine-protein phosphatase [Skermania sp. ID1734]TSE01871.1 tyrosine-protein phosphatase [Skermania sp. ID1734]
MTGVDEDQFQLSGAWNFRDVGGLRTADGRAVRPRILLRSSQLAGLDDAGRERLLELGVTDVFDLRSYGEAERAGADQLPPGVRLHATPFFPPRTDTETAPHEAHELTAERARSYMLAEYPRFVASDGARTAIIETTRAITEYDGVALVHCAAGKDRTGWLIATLLRAIGVTDDDIVADFLRSNDAIEPLKAMLAAKFGEPVHGFDEMLGVRAEYLESAMKAVDELYGSFGDYLTAIGINETVLARLRDRLLA